MQAPPSRGLGFHPYCIERQKQTLPYLPSLFPDYWYTVAFCLKLPYDVFPVVIDSTLKPWVIGTPSFNKSLLLSIFCHNSEKNNKALSFLDDFISAQRLIRKGLPTLKLSTCYYFMDWQTYWFFLLRLQCNVTAKQTLASYQCDFTLAY